MRKLRVSVQTRFMGNSSTMLKMAESLYDLKKSFIVSIFLCARNEIYSEKQLKDI